MKKNDKLSIMTGRSMCTHCGHQLAVIDLVPVLSYVWLRGKCRYCHKPIEDTPIAEILVPVLFGLSYLWWPYGFNTVWSMGSVLFYIWLVFLVGFVVLALYDLRWFILPDKVIFPLIGLAALELAAMVLVFDGGWAVLLDAAWGVLCLAGLFWFLYVISRGKWIGFGDVKLAIILGILVGGPLDAILVLFIASLLGSVIALPMLIQGKATAKTRLPFGPLLLAGTVAVMLFGGYMTAWYSNLLLIR